MKAIMIVKYECGHVIADGKTYNTTIEAFGAVSYENKDEITACNLRIEVTNFPDKCPVCKGKKVFVYHGDTSVARAKINPALVDNIIRELNADGLECHFEKDIDSIYSLFEYNLKEGEAIVLTRDGVALDPMFVLFPGAMVYEVIVLDMMNKNIYRVPQLQKIGSYEV